MRAIIIPYALLPQI